MKNKHPEYLTRTQSRMLDQIAIDEFGIPGIVLMENAARGVVDVLLQQGDVSSVLILCGTGNNGGDGFAIARHLVNGGVKATIGLWGSADSVRGDAKINLDIARKMKIDIEEIDPNDEQQVDSFFQRHRELNYSWIIDAILGTGATLPLRGSFSKLIEFANRFSAKRLAVDIPTGVDCDTGDSGAVRFHADLTCTFVCKKTGFDRSDAAAIFGNVHVIDIGVPHEIVEKAAAIDK